MSAEMVNPENIFAPAGVPAIDKTIERMEHRLAAARQLRVIAREYPELIEEMFGEKSAGLGDLFTGAENGEGPKRKSGGLPNHLLIVKYFLDNDNAWQQAPRIGEALNLTRGTVATVLWTTRAEQFEKRSVPGSIKKKAWRLKPDRIPTLRAELETAQRKEDR